MPLELLCTGERAPIIFWLLCPTDAPAACGNCTSAFNSRCETFASRSSLERSVRCCASLCSMMAIPTTAATISTMATSARRCEGSVNQMLRRWSRISVAECGFGESMCPASIRRCDLACEDVALACDDGFMVDTDAEGLIVGSWMTEACGEPESFLIVVSLGAVFEPEVKFVSIESGLISRSDAVRSPAGVWLTGTAGTRISTRVLCSARATAGLAAPEGCRRRGRIALCGWFMRQPSLAYEVMVAGDCMLRRPTSCIASLSTHCAENGAVQVYRVLPMPTLSNSTITWTFGFG
jgi:hypothetical protein